MSKEERYTYHCDQYDYVEIIYDNEECEEIDSMKMAEKRLNRQQDKISDLEAKLAESEERINWLVEAEFNRKWAKKYVEMRRKEDPMLCLPDSDEVYERYFELKQQLAEKEKEITQRLVIQEKDYNQDKISFALEQLEKVKETFNWGKDNNYLTPQNAVNIIDNQIKQLKEMK